MIVLALGGVTAVLGVLYALMQHDLKRLLAYQHGREHRHHLHRPRPGARLPGERHGRAAALALTAALFHVLNHSLFKSLLFFGAGAVLTATGERDMERSAASSTACRTALRLPRSAASRSRRCRRSTASSPSG
jgi:hydrogenase-4 component B